jgi:uncharacterized membrane protein
MTLDPQQMLQRVRAEWIAMVFGLLANVILIAYLGWRLAIINDVVNRKEIEFHMIWTVQEELKNNQREMLSRQAEALRILGPYDYQARMKAKAEGR